MRQDRRSFLRSMMRLGAGALLVGGAGLLSLRSGKPCWADAGCRRCPELDGCEMPEARLTRAGRQAPAPVEESPGEEPRG